MNYTKEEISKRVDEARQRLNYPSLMDVEQIIRPFDDLAPRQMTVSVQSRSANCSCHTLVSDDLLKIGGIEYLMQIFKGMRQSMEFQYHNGLLYKEEK